MRRLCGAALLEIREADNMRMIYAFFIVWAAVSVVVVSVGIMKNMGGIA